MAWLQSFFGTKKAPAGEEGSALDAVTYLGSLASDPRAVDPILDPIREITSRLEPGQALSAKDQHTLAVVYGQLVSYLVAKEPLRVFNKNDLRARIQERFPNHKANETAFWDKVGIL